MPRRSRSLRRPRALGRAPLFGVAAVLVLAATGAAAPAAAAGAGVSPHAGDPAACLNATEAAFLKLINDYRADHGAGPLVAGKKLNTASYLHSKDMADNDYFDHDSPDGSTPEDRMDAAGYEAEATGENIAAGYPTAKEVFDTWRDSPGHNRNMLDDDYRAIGIGLASNHDSEYDQYWTTDFGSKLDPAPDCPAS